MNVLALGRDLLTEARRADGRRLLVLAGERTAGYDALADLLATLDVPCEGTTLVEPPDSDGVPVDLPCERLTQHHAGELLGATRDAVVVDVHGGLRPNALGRVVGAVDGGGLLILLTPTLDEWPDRDGEFDRTLAVPPFELGDVTSHFRRRLVETLLAHPGIAVVDVAAGTVEHDGLTNPPPRVREAPAGPPDGHAFPLAAYEACLTDDQVDAVHALEALRERGNAVVVEADRGRGKSAAAGLAAASLAAEGRDVLVTAPEFRGAAEVFVRAEALLGTRGALAGGDSQGESDPPKRIKTRDGGRIRFEQPVDARELPGDPNVVLVDEAAALPVRVLSSFLSAPSVAFTTTVHGYEGAGRGFSVRFRDRLANPDLELTEVGMAEPIRYAAGDPVEVWAFRALLLDASPPADQLVVDARPDGVEYRALDPEDLLADEHLLREAFGLLVLAHYRTEPNDLARLLDAPNLSARALLYEGHVVSVALLAREGDLPPNLRAEMYDGARVPGNMIPDVLTSQLRDEAAGEPAGLRVMRIATHPAVRSRGMGSRLLSAVRREFEDLDWVGTGFGATPGLVRFWENNGYATVHLATTRNEASGEYSILMLDPLSDEGTDLHDRHAAWFLDRARDVLSDPLSDADPDVVRAALRATDWPVDPDLSPRDWTVVADTAYGPGLYTSAVGAFRRLAVAYLADSSHRDLLDERLERLLVLKVLQGRPWSAVVDELGFHSYGEAMRALGRGYQPLVDAYGDEAARRQRERYE
ncbi:tRNA(Met) cytidine acetyltransferase [Halobacteriales archaeon QS_1_68_20]|nr:MAG: tRNA(Met) cytidine acetyltransferase [Halobacteriales archaeon QS_1_68_20]